MIEDWVTRILSGQWSLAAIALLLAAMSVGLIAVGVHDMIRCRHDRDRKEQA